MTLFGYFQIPKTLNLHALESLIFELPQIY